MTSGVRITYTCPPKERQTDMGERYTILASGERYFIERPEDCAFNIEDIATGLSRQCRFNGQFAKFSDSIYAVTQHSILVDDIVNKLFEVREARPWAIAHDAMEGILGDIISPVKFFCPEFSEIEDKGADLLRDYYAVPYDDSIRDIVHKADILACAMEAEALTDIPAVDWGLPKPPISMQQLYGDDWKPMGILESREAFLVRWSEVIG
ncbi:HD superfamily hydrolase [Ruegeria phage RpAliso]|nr:HD superfamily hydrolase [Ruegeria phage RpAliso]